MLCFMIPSRLVEYFRYFVNSFQIHSNFFQHLQALESLLQDFLLREHLLLVGNQGVGKNRLIDRLLSLLNRPREYIQLHR